MTTILPKSWRPSQSALLPCEATIFRGPKLAEWFAIAYLLLITARSLVHLFSPDGGAHSIATIDTAVPGGGNIIALFGQWGAIQLLLAALLWVLLLRYRGLVPLILCVFLLEPFFRGLAGHLKPVVTMGVAPGAALNWIVAPIIGAALYLALCPAEGDGGTPKVAPR